MSKQDYDKNWAAARVTALEKGHIIIEHGWEQHVIIDESAGYVFRYPRHENAAEKLADEIAVLTQLQTLNLPLPIPNLVEHTEKYSKYLYIPGTVLNHSILHKISDKEIGDIGSQLGNFLQALHQVSPSVVTAKLTKQKTSLLQYYENRITKAKKSPHQQPALAALMLLKDRCSFNSNSQVVHGDLHGLNIVISKDKKQVNGIIDWSETEIGDPHQDLRKLFMTDPRLLAPAVNAYKESGGLKLNEATVKLWAYVNEWANLCFFHDQPTNFTYQRSLGHLQRWKQLN